jgi:hypothetical protein
LTGSKLSVIVTVLRKKRLPAFTEAEGQTLENGVRGLGVAAVLSTVAAVEESVPFIKKYVISDL